MEHQWAYTPSDSAVPAASLWLAASLQILRILVQCSENILMKLTLDSLPKPRRAAT